MQNDRFKREIRTEKLHVEVYIRCNRELFVYTVAAKIAAAGRIVKSDGKWRCATRGV